MRIFFAELKLHIKLYLPVYFILSLPGSIIVVYTVLRAFVRIIAPNMTNPYVQNTLALVKTGSFYEWSWAAVLSSALLSVVVKCIAFLLKKKKTVVQKLLVLPFFLFVIFALLYELTFLYYFSLLINKNTAPFLSSWLFMGVFSLTLFLQILHFADKTGSLMDDMDLSMQVAAYVYILISSVVFIFFLTPTISVLFKYLYVFLFYFIKFFYRCMCTYHFLFGQVLFVLILLIARCRIFKKIVDRYVGVESFDIIVCFAICMLIYSLTFFL